MDTVLFIMKLWSCSIIHIPHSQYHTITITIIILTMPVLRFYFHNIHVYSTPITHTCRLNLRLVWMTSVPFPHCELYQDRAREDCEWGRGNRNNYNIGAVNEYFLEGLKVGDIVYICICICVCECMNVCICVCEMYDIRFGEISEYNGSRCDFLMIKSLPFSGWLGVDLA